MFRGVDRVEVVDRLDEAVELASRITSPGQTVLLSPGCASFDHYSGFEARGDHFRTLVDALRIAVLNPSCPNPIRETEHDRSTHRR